MGSIRPNEGRLEIYLEQHWGTVCSRNFNDTDAMVACRQLSLDFTGAKVVTDHYAFDHGVGMMWFTTPSCSGNEDRLTDCFIRDYQEMLFGCDLIIDVGIRCLRSVRAARTNATSAKATPWEQHHMVLM
ncbi:macrophage scavenger receptor types I and II-like [Diadema antillarum]|uniref:macrophage scavenger receptor types I and II-like n=1 Tax=Diadema antillarum TaxID=105358 RepID=UPI003A87DD3F